MAFEFENTHYPELNLSSTAGRVRFAGGRFTTEDSELAEALTELPDWYGIRAVSAPEPAAAVETEQPAEDESPEPLPAAEDEQPKPNPAPRGRRKGGA
ncbi:hypothetical protein ACWGRF_02075 [Streptomyces zhihengii]